MIIPWDQNATNDAKKGEASNFPDTTPFQAPPAYASGSGSNAAASSSAGPADAITTQGIRVNHHYVDQNSSSIQGIFVLDPDLPNPSPNPETTPDNLHLNSYNGTVSATVAVLGSSPRKASIIAQSYNKKVTLNIASRSPATRIRIVANSRNAGVVVFIPRDFCGILRFSSHNKSTVFSPAISANLTPFSHGKVGSGFIGRYPAPEYGDVNVGTWAGDEMDLQSHNGSIKIYYADEPIQPSEWDLLRQDVSESGPIGGFVKTIKRNIANRVAASRTEEPRQGFVYMGSSNDFKG